MCQLLGISYDRPTPFNRVFAEFRGRGRENPHAWGVAYWTGDGRGPAVVREARAAHASPLAAAVAGAKIPATTVVAHVRYATTAGAWSKNVTVNAHPFLFNVATEKGCRDWAFAHNGYVQTPEDPPFRRPEGTTDSEHFFAIVADALEKGGAETVQDACKTIARVAASCAGRGRLNFLASDGETLFFHASHPESLYFRVTKSGGKRALVVATRPLFTESGWVAAEPGVVYAARGGELARREKAAEKPAWRRASPRVSGRHLSYIDYLEAGLAPRQEELF